MSHSYAGAIIMAETHAAEKEGFTVSSSTCKRYFGYLGQREKGAAMPDDCLTCGKMIDCMFSKPDHPVVTTEREPEPPQEEEIEIQETVEDEPTAPVTYAERVEPVIVAHPETEAEPEKEEIQTLTMEALKPVERQKPAQIPIRQTAVDEFVVETPGHMYNQWSGTVLISKETLEALGKKVKEVYVTTGAGISVKCRVYVTSDIGQRIIQIPDRLKADLVVEDGDYVRVTPK